MLNKRIKYFGMLILVVSLAITLTACDIGNGVVEDETLIITSIEEIPDETVEYGTDFEDVDLPEEIGVTLDDNTTTTLSVIWLEGDYDGETAGTYTIVGELELTDNITNPNDLYPTVEVTVLEEVDIPEYTVTVNYDANKGTVEGYGDYEEGEEVELTAIPNEGYEFVEWTGYVEDTDNTIIFDMPAEDVELTAVFEEEEVEPEVYELTINIEGEGNTVPEEGTHEYEEGTTVDLEAIPDEGWKFIEWKGDIASTDTEVKVIMDSDKSITAVFEEKDEEPPIKYTDDYLGLEVGLEMEGVRKSEAVFYDEEDNEVFSYSDEYASKSIVASKEYDNGTAEFIVQGIEDEEITGGSIYQREEEKNYYLAGVIDEEENKNYFVERKEVLRGEIEEGDKITIPVDFQPENNNEEVLIEPITLEARSFEKVVVEAGEFMAWRLEGEKKEWIVDEEFIVNLEGMKAWFVPYLGTVKEETEMEIDFLDPEEPLYIDTAVINNEFELFYYSK